MRSWIVVGILAAAGVAANAAVWQSMQNPGAHESGFWHDMASVKVPAHPDVPAVFPESIRSQEGRRVTLSGVVFLMQAGIADGSVRWCVLMPPSRYGCCGVSCDPQPEMSVYVDCARAPWPAPGTQLMAEVEGTLRLDRSAGTWCLSTLEDATVRPIDP